MRTRESMARDDVAQVETRRPSDAGGAGGDEEMPTVSAIVATRDRPELLRQALTAIRDQHYDGVVETVVVFDQSEPDRSLASTDTERPVRVVSNERGPGLACARNTGILAASGDLIAFCDDDDVWLPEKLREQVALLERHPGTDVVMGGCVIVYEGHRRQRVLAQPWLTLDDLLRSRVQEAHPSTILARRDAVLERIGLVDEDLPGSYGEDHDWMIRAARCGDIALVGAPLAEIRWHRQSFFADRWRTIAVALEYMVDKHPEFADQPVGRANLYGRKAFAHAALGERGEARRWAVRSLRCNPLDRRAGVALLVSTGLVTADTALRLAHRIGRGI